jgi:hypothetical protein
MRDENTRLEN